MLGHGSLESQGIDSGNIGSGLRAGSGLVRQVGQSWHGPDGNKKSRPLVVGSENGLIR